MHVLTLDQYQHCHRAYNQACNSNGKNGKDKMTKEEKRMDEVLKSHRQRETVRALYGSFWGPPTGLATVIASGTASKLQAIAPGMDVQKAVSDLNSHINLHLKLHAGEMGTLLDDNCRSAVMRQETSRKSDKVPAQSLSFELYHQTWAKHNTNYQRRCTCRAQQPSDVRK